jgi:hypothetical protein
LKIPIEKVVLIPIIAPFRHRANKTEGQDDNHRTDPDS